MRAISDEQGRNSLPQPWVKWAYEPERAEDVPAAFMRAYAMALQPPAGPVFLSIPLDDWEKPALGPAVIRTVSHRVSPDVHGCAVSPSASTRAQRPLLVFGPEVDRSGAWDAAWPSRKRWVRPYTPARFRIGRRSPRITRFFRECCR